jgi:hypothetical protein
MFNKILQLLAIRCAHRKLSLPFAAFNPAPAHAVNANWGAPTAATRHYVVCLDCGHKFDYDWTTMRMSRD